MTKNLLSTTLLASAMALPIAGTFAEAALAAKDNFVVYNDSRLTIVELYVSASNRTTWDNNILNGDVLGSGDSTRVVFGDPSPSTCLYDILAVFADGQTVEDYQINVCDSTGYTFYDQ